MRTHLHPMGGVSVSAILWHVSASDAAFAQGTDSALVRGAVYGTRAGLHPGRPSPCRTTNQDPHKATTDQMGRYIFQVLSPLLNTATVESQGFKSVERKNIISAGRRPERTSTSVSRWAASPRRRSHRQRQRC